MIGRIAGVAVFLFVMASHGEEYRVFTDTEGRSIEARIVEYDSAKGRLRIERSDGKKVWAPANIFSKEDREYIEQWIAADLVLSDSNIRISLKKENRGDFGSKKDLKEGENIGFEVEFRNRSNVAIEGLRVEYRYFVSKIGSGRSQDSHRTVPGTLTLSRLDPRQTLKVTTETIPLTTVWNQTREQAGWDYNGQALYNTSMSKVSEDELDGIWLRVYGPSVGGVPSYRDVSYPKDLKDKRKW